MVAKIAEPLAIQIHNLLLCKKNVNLTESGLKAAKKIT
ncbi:Uncharacterised protein [Mycoplasma putrefaciens]|nr:Uncharacterised protein [Mycoplasma putrefaciens]